MEHKCDITGDKDSFMNQFMNHYEVWNPPPVKNTEQLLGWVWIEPEQNVTESETK